MSSRCPSRRRFKLAAGIGALLLGLLLWARPSEADVYFDGSMGPAGEAPTRVDPDFSTDYLITYDERTQNPGDRYGIRRGRNLFQSLDRIDLELDERATFQALDGLGLPIDDLDRIVARITSGNRSVIEGVLRSEVPGADLFLLNPAGIDFLGEGGNRRQLDLQGGFVASTANFLRFEDDSVLEIDALDDFTLSSTPVESFGFSGGGSSSIVFDGTGLMRVADSEQFTVVAGDVVLTGGDGATSRLRSPDATVQIGAVGRAAAEVPLDLAAWDTRGSEAGQLGEVRVEAFSELRTTDASAGGLGRIVLRGGRLVVDDSRVQAGGRGVDSLALDVEFSDEVLATEDARLQTFGARPEGVGAARIATRRFEASGSIRSTRVGSVSNLPGASAAPFTIEADEVLIAGNVRVLTQGGGLGGTGGELIVRAGSIEVDGFDAAVGTRTSCFAPPCGSVGGLATIEAERLVVKNGGKIVSDSFFQGPAIDPGGPAGDLHIDVGELILESEGRIEALAGTAGPGGEIVVRADTIAMSGSAEINATTVTDQESGDISVTATESLTIRGDVQNAPTGIFSRSGELLNVGTGDAGDILVDAPIVTLEGEAVFSTRSRGEGNPGSIRVIADELTLRGTDLGRAEIAARAKDGDTGGSVNVTADSVLLDKGGIAVSTTGTSRGGKVDLDATTLTIQGVGVGPAGILSDTAQTSPLDGGDAGEIDIDLVDSLLVSDGGVIRAVTSGGPGNAGSISIDAGTSVSITTGASISAAAIEGAAGEAGNVSINAPVIILDGGSVTTEALNGTADGIVEPIGGNIDFDAGSAVRITDGSLVSARSLGTQDAGRISIDAGLDLFVADSEITTEATEETANAAGGQIDITAIDEIEFLRSRVTTSVRASEGNENGGDITIDPRFVIVNQSEILAQAILGNGGNITIIANNYLESADSLVDASSELGIDGKVNVEAPDTQIKDQLTRLPSRFLDATELLREHCAARVSGSGSFLVTGSEGGAAAPVRPLSAQMPLPETTSPPTASRPSTPVTPRPSDFQLRLDALDCKALESALAARGVLP